MINVIEKSFGNPAPEPILMEDENGVELEYKPIEEFQFRGKRYAAYYAECMDSTIVLELKLKDGELTPEFIPENLESEVLAYYSNLHKEATPPTPPAPPQRPSLDAAEIKAALDKKYAIAGGLPDWDILPPSQIITRTKRA